MSSERNDIPLDDILEIEDLDLGEENVGGVKELASPFYRQQTAFFKTPKATKHVASLILATFIMIVMLAEVACNMWLVTDFLSRGYTKSAALLIFTYVIAFLNNALFDYLNEGRLKYMMFDLLQLRVLVLYVEYYRERYRHVGQSWRDNDFRTWVKHESFPTAIPALVIQTYVIMTDRTVNAVQIIAFLCNFLSGIVCLLRYFKYVSLSMSAYVEMMLKAIISTSMRAMLSALVIMELRYLALLGVFASYVTSLILYYLSVQWTRRTVGEDPLKFNKCHIWMANAMALKYLFMSLPFSPNHSIEMWWLGYLISETKLQIENSLLVAFLAYKYNGQDLELVAAGIFFSASMFLLNFVILYFLHKSVKLTLFERPVYSSKLIVKLYAHLCSYQKDMIQNKIDKIVFDDKHNFFDIEGDDDSAVNNDNENIYDADENDSITTTSTTKNENISDIDEKDSTANNDNEIISDNQEHSSDEDMVEVLEEDTD